VRGKVGEERQRDNRKRRGDLTQRALRKSAEGTEKKEERKFYGFGS
jgi:hypothetical protein